MMHLRDLVLFLLCLAGGARRSMRINDSHRDMQQQGNTLANGLEVSTEAEEALVPGVSWTVFGRAGPQTGALSKESEYRATSSRFGPRRTLDALMASSGTENDLNTASAINRRAVLRSVAALPIAAPVLAYDTAPVDNIDVVALEKARAERDKQNKKIGLSSSRISRRSPRPQIRILSLTLLIASPYGSSARAHSPRA